ncbi:MAG: PepSY domain-containing protein, partial [Ectothiorhodospiraceae bacterium]|nr:PepSY domain-containing protein [Ectothiorhodospiraceae bacterium]
MKEGFRQSMAWLHTWAGLILGWVLFFMFVTGTAGYFDTEIDRWMQPELPVAQHDTPAVDVAAMGVSLLREEAPGAARWVIAMPIDRNDPYPRRFWQGADTESGAIAANGNERFDASSGEPFSARATGGGQHLYRMHWRLHYLPRSLSDWLIGLATMFMLVAITSGIIIHKKIFKDFFTFRPGKGQRSWLDAHNVLSVLALPFHVMITYSGLIFMAFAYMPLVIAATYGTGPEARQTMIQEVFSLPVVERSGEPASLTALGPLIDTAEERWGPGVLRHVDIHHPGDRNAYIILRASHAQGPVRSGEELHFDGVSGELIDTIPAITSAPNAAWTVLLGLHEGLFAGPVLRWLYFLSGILGTGMVGTGLVLWTVKRRQQAERRASGSHRG